MVLNDGLILIKVDGEKVYVSNVLGKSQIRYVYMIGVRSGSLAFNLFVKAARGLMLQSGIVPGNLSTGRYHQS